MIRLALLLGTILIAYAVALLTHSAAAFVGIMALGVMLHLGRLAMAARR